MTSIQKVAEWVNDAEKPVWWRHSIQLAIKNSELAESDLQFLFKIAKMEVGLIPKDNNYSDYISDVSPIGFEAEDYPVNLIRLGNIKNIFSLIDSQFLEFKPTGLTAVYGDNGTGKSSYTKILKNTCLARGDIPVIMGNIFSSSPTFPQATLTIQINNEQPKDIIWQNGCEPISELKSIRVFDAQAANHYISKEDSIEYKPAGLKLLDELIKTCEFVKSQVTNDIRNLEPEQKFPITTQGTSINLFLQNIGITTTEADIDKHCASQDEISSLIELKKELTELSTQTPEELRKKYSKKRLRLEPFRNFLINLKTQLSDESINFVKQLYDDQQNKVVAAELIRKQTFEKLPLNGIGTAVWVTMWQAVEQFILKIEPQKSFPPKEGEHCPMCLQPIQFSASERLASFHRYLKDQTQMQAMAAVKGFKEKQEQLSKLNFNIDPFSAVLNDINQYKPELGEKFNQLLIDLQTRNDQLLREVPDFLIQPLDLSAFNWLVSRINNLQEQENNIVNSDELAKTVQRLQNQILEIEDRQKLALHKLLILNEIKRKICLSKLKDIENKAKTTSITRLATEISQEEGVNLLGKYFTEELKFFGFKHLNVETNIRGSNGKQLFKLKLAEKTNKLIDIASEGEQKCIALAGFLAELKIENRKSAIIFDDPVNSLDHIWRRKFAERISLEAKNRQVIVFTHDLPFLKLLEEATNDDINIIAITRSGQYSGLSLQRPPWDSMKTQARIGELKNRLPQLRKQYQTGNRDDYNEQAKNLYGKKRETWERLVEEWLIKSVVERFSREVKTQNTRYLVGITEDDIKRIEAAMTKCSTFFDGHDFAIALGVDIPDIDELEKDVTELESYFTQLKSRRK